MWARVTALTMAADRLPAAQRHIDERIVPALKAMDGFHSAYWLYDAARGAALNITLWESEQAVRLTESQAGELRKAAQGLGAHVDSVETYEVTNRA